MISNKDELRAIYGQPKRRAVTKEIQRLDEHCRRFIEQSPFLVMASGAADGHFDASPRGGEPGFVRVLDERTLLIPDSPGNNRLDSLENILSCGRVGLLFLIPGIDETLRVNGDARILTDAGTLEHFSAPPQLPKSVIRVSVAEAYVHCPKAMVRSRLWDPASRVQRSALPSPGEMMRAMVERYKSLL